MSSLDAISLHCILITLRDLILESLAKCNETIQNSESRTLHASNDNYFIKNV